jgi:hypothetical protein
MCCQPQGRAAVLRRTPCTLPATRAPRCDPGGRGTRRALTTWWASALLVAEAACGLNEAPPHGHPAWVVTPAWARAALTHRVVTGLSRHHLAKLIVEPADPWTAAHQAALHQRRGHARRRAAGAGPRHRLVFADRVLVTLVALRLQLPHRWVSAAKPRRTAASTTGTRERTPLKGWVSSRPLPVSAQTSRYRPPPDMPSVPGRSPRDAHAHHPGERSAGQALTAACVLGRPAPAVSTAVHPGVHQDDPASSP